MPGRTLLAGVPRSLQALDQRGKEEFLPVHVGLNDDSAFHARSQPEQL